MPRCLKVTAGSPIARQSGRVSRCSEEDASDVRRGPHFDQSRPSAGARQPRVRLARMGAGQPDPTDYGVSDTPL